MAKARKRPKGQDSPARPSRTPKPKRVKKPYSRSRSPQKKEKEKEKSRSAAAKRPRKRPAPARLPKLVGGKNRPTGLRVPVQHRDRYAPGKGATREERALAKARKQHALQGRRLQKKADALVRKRLRGRLKQTDIDERLHAAAEWIDVVRTRARELGHTTRVSQANNADGTADLQIGIYRWKPSADYTGRVHYGQAVFEMFADLLETLPNLEPGVRVRHSVRLRADHPKGKRRLRERFQYLPQLPGGDLPIFFAYRRRGEVPAQIWALQERVNRYLADGGITIGAIVVDVRFDPVWIESERKEGEAWEAIHKRRAREKKKNNAKKRRAKAKAEHIKSGAESAPSRPKKHSRRGAKEDASRTRAGRRTNSSKATQKPARRDTSVGSRVRAPARSPRAKKQTQKPKSRKR